MPNRTAGVYFNNTLCTWEIDMGQTGTYVEYSGFLATYSDAGATAPSSTYRDFDGGVEQTIGSPEGGTISGSVWVTAGAAEYYRVMDGARLPPASIFDARRTVTDGTNTIIHTYTGCYCQQLGAGEMDANGSGPLVADHTITYSSRAIS